MAVAYTSYLRVFVPLSAYPDARRRQWEQYVADGPVPTRHEAEEMEQALLLAVVRDGAPDLSRLPTQDHAFAEPRGDEWLICPWDTTTRALRAVASGPGVVGHPIDIWYATAASARAAEALLRRRGERAWPETDDVSAVQIREEPWGVPGPWFALFASGERILDRGPSGVQLRYRTSMRQARRRTNSTLRVIRAVAAEHPVVLELVELARWLGTFDAASMVELDYGGLARLVDLASLELDDSPGELRQAIGFAKENDLDAAAEQYQFIHSRWEDLRQVHRWN